MKTQNLKYIFLFILVGLFFFDLGNINGLRQGTEGFYLLISQEMYEARDLLTPRIYGDFHWSKPPFQFWLPMPFVKLFGGSYLFWARFSILSFSFLCIGLISLWYEDQLKRNWYEAFCGLIIPFYFIKYSRIFMMEAALTLLSTLAVLYLYSYLDRGKRKHLAWGAIFTGLSILVKGPVSVAMIAPPVFIFSFLKKKSFTRYFQYMIAGGIIGSLWFIASYVRFGDDFFNYFFIRENLGKFTSKTYPARHVLQGLLIYAFPIWILLFSYWKKVPKLIKEKEVNLFFFLSFLFFFLLWFLPKQRSHHYAVPSIPLFSLFIIYNYFEEDLKEKFKFKILTNVYHFFFLISGLILFVFWYFRADLALGSNSLYYYGAFFTLGIWSFSHQKPKNFYPLLKFATLFHLVWLFLLPMGILPIVPNNIADQLNSSKTQVFVNYRKPFFIKESLNREVELLRSGDLKDPRIQSGDIIFLPEYAFLNSDAKNQYTQLDRWKVWIRGNGAKQIKNALQQGSLKSLQEFYTIIERK